MIWHDEYFATAGRAEPHFGGAGFTRGDWEPVLDLGSGWDVPTDLYCLPPLHVATIHDGFFSVANCLPVPGLLPHVRSRMEDASGKGERRVMVQGPRRLFYRA